MDILKTKQQQLLRALATLETSINTFQACDRSTKSPIENLDYDEARRVLRDSMVQRFEYCADLFWKFLKKRVEKIDPAVLNSPTPVIRAAYKIGILREKDAEQALKINDSRNLTSHIYREEIAEQLAKDIPVYYKLMHAVTKKLTN